MFTPQSDPEIKCEAVSRLLRNGMTMIHLDPRNPKVKVPPRFHKQEHMALNFSWNFPNAQMTLSDEGIEALLEFDGVQSWVYVPWVAVLGAHLVKKAATAPVQAAPRPKPELIVDNTTKGKDGALSDPVQNPWLRLLDPVKEGQA